MKTERENIFTEKIRLQLKLNETDTNFHKSSSLLLKSEKERLQLRNMYLTVNKRIDKFVSESESGSNISPRLIESMKGRLDSTEKELRKSNNLVLKCEKKILAYREKMKIMDEDFQKEVYELEKNVSHQRNLLKENLDEC